VAADECSAQYSLQKNITLKSIHADSMKYLITVKVSLRISHPHPKNLSNSEFG
jgi:hypothetical protein